MSIINTPPFPGGKRVYIPRNVWNDMQHLADACEVEVSAIGLVCLAPEGIVIDELYVPQQLVGEAHAQVDGAMLSEAQAHWFNEGRIIVGDTKYFVRFNWHSHVDMRAEFSPPDKVQSASMGGDFGEMDPPWWISMVQNRKGEYTVFFEMFQPVRRTLDITDDVIIGHPQHAPARIIEVLNSRVKRGRRGK